MRHPMRGDLDAGYGLEVGLGALTTLLRQAAVDLHRRQMRSPAHSLGRPANQTWLGLGLGVPLGSGFLVVVDHRTILLFEPASRQPAACRRASAVAQTICSDSVFSFARPASISASSLRARLASSP